MRVQVPPCPPIITNLSNSQNSIKRLEKKLSYVILFLYLTSLGGEIGIHEGLKIPWEQSRAGSSPAPGTNNIILHKMLS